MHRTIAALVTAALALAACGGDDDEASADTAGTAGASEPTEAPAASAPAASAPPDEAEEPSTEPTFEDVGPPPTSPDKPVVQIPDAIPTELTTTVLVEGEGPPAEVGDTVIVDYIGVRSRDGEEFDNSYDRFEPFPVPLGTGSVIQGWDDGLVGAQAGDQLQLDIPSDLAYGSQARGDVIGEDEALTFVIDVRSVIKQSDPADQPTEPGVPASDGATEVIVVDLVEGEGAELVTEQTAVLNFVLFRGDNGVALETSWGNEPLQIPMIETEFLSGLVDGMLGMRVGGRRAITIPPEQGFGAEGSPQVGLPANTDIIIVVDLLGAY